MVDIYGPQFALELSLLAIGLAMVLWGLDKTEWLKGTWAKVMGVLYVLVGLFFFYIIAIMNGISNFLIVEGIESMVIVVLIVKLIEQSLKNKIFTKNRFRSIEERFEKF